MKKLFKICLIILLFKFYVTTQEKTKDHKDSSIKSEVIKVRSDILDSITRLKNRIKYFFTITLKKFETRRRKIKKAFLRFLDEAFTNKSYNCTPERFSMNNQDLKLSAPELIVMHGYRSETHTVLTSDGYMITVHRLLPQLTNITRIERRVAILQHGLLGSSMDWILLGPKRALPYLLSDAGFDVWLPNARGNKYSKAHVNKAAESVKFWDFSWHEIGLYDTPAIIDYVKENIHIDAKMFFIAYSMSATALLVLLSTLPQYNSDLTSVVLLAPLIYLRDVRGPLRYLADRYEENSPLGLSRHEYSNFPAEEILEEKVLNKFCRGPRILCQNPLLLLGDGGKIMNNINTTAYILDNVPSGGSKKTIVHYLQIIHSGLFQMFDFGVFENYKKYGKKFPPLYNLNKINNSLILFNSENDWLSTVSDTNILLDQLPNAVIHHFITSKDFSHLDFMWSNRALKLVYSPLIAELNNV